MEIARKRDGLTINATKKSLAETIRKQNVQGVGTVLDTTGVPSAMNDGLTLLASGGRMVLFASSRPNS